MSTINRTEWLAERMSKSQGVAMLYEIGLTIQQIAIIYGTSIRRLKSLMRTEGIEIKPRGFHRTLPTRQCSTCGKQLVRHHFRGDLETTTAFLARKTCSTKCGYAMRTSVPTKSASGSRLRATKILGSGPCAKCAETTNIDVHHIDENPFNNTHSNLIRLCRSCHKKVHAGVLAL